MFRLGPISATTSRVVPAALVGLILVLGVGASVLVYMAAERVARSNHALTQTHLPHVRLVSESRSDLLEHERLAYELYAVIDSARMRPPIDRQQEYVATQLTLLAARLPPKRSEILTEKWRRIVSEMDRLAWNIARDSPDWDAARGQLQRISEYRSALDPILDELALDAQAQVAAAEDRNRGDLTFMSSLVLIYSACIVLIALAVGWMLRRLISANARNYALAQFPERNPMPVLTLDQRGRVEYANKAAYRFVAECAGCSGEMNVLVPQRVTDRILETIGRQSKGHLEHDVGNALLSYHWYWLPDRLRYHLYIRDITAQRDAQQRLERMAFEDEITGLPNRNAMLAHLSEHTGGDGDSCLAVLNIERFYLLLVTQGFQAADQILRRFSELLAPCASAALGANTQVARIEGAMFALHWKSGKDRAALELDLDLLMDRLPEVIRSGHVIFHAEYRMGIRVIATGDTSAPEALFSDADAALRHVESGMAGRYMIHDANIREQQQQVLVIEQRLRVAMAGEDSGLTVYLQPKVDLQQRIVVGAEALLRWHDPELGVMGPGRFVPIAEQSGLIMELGQWVLHRVLRLLQRWTDDPLLSSLHIALNVAPGELQIEGYGDRVLDLLHETGVPPEKLEIEITERVLADAQAIGRVDSLGKLRRAGVGVSLDDFGTGYSSLGYLSSMPVSHIKIDKKFVDRVPPEVQAGPSLVGIIVNLAKQLGLECVAEGVESVDQVCYLRSIGCRFAQGYYYAKALPVAEFEALARNGLRVNDCL